jgi:hypothetical protein
LLFFLLDKPVDLDASTITRRDALAVPLIGAIRQEFPRTCSASTPTSRPRRVVNGDGRASVRQRSDANEHGVSA